MHEHQKMVLAFHEKFGLTINKIPNVPVNKDIALRINLNTEELKELFEALLNDLNVDVMSEPAIVPGLSRALIGIADACADLKYVVYGAATTWGLALAYEEKKVGAFGIQAKDRPTDYSIFMLATIVSKGMEANRRFIQACIKDKFGCAHPDFDEIKASLENMIEYTYAIERGAGINIDPIFEEVQRSNMSKLWEDGSVHRRPEDGKIMKPPTYSPADIPGVLKKQL